MYTLTKKDDALDQLVNASVKFNALTSEDVTKDESTQNNSQVTAIHQRTSRFARKSGLKPIRPTVSTSSLMPVTPGKHTMFSSAFKENDPARGQQFDKAYTPKSSSKFLRSESTPELNRFKKAPLMMSTDKGDTQLHSERKRSEHSSCYTLSAATTNETLPDIFCKPLTQQQSDSVFNYKFKPKCLEEKMSKWGYGPTNDTSSSTGSQSVETSPPESLKQSQNLDVVPVELELGISKLSEVKLEESSLQPRLNKWSTLTSAPSAKEKFPNNSASTFSCTIEKPVHLNSSQNTSLVLSSVSQNTIKPQLKAEVVSAVVKSASPVVTTAVDSNVSHLEMRPPPARKEQEKPAFSSVTQPLPAQVSGLAKNEEVKPAPVLDVKGLPQNRTSIKGKQISVSGKIFTVMKPLGRGGSSVVYQVLNSEMTDMFALKVVRLDSVDEVTAEGYINEVRLLKHLQGLPRVVRLLEYEYNEIDEKLLLVMEKGDTDFASVVRNRSNDNNISPTLIRFYWQEMLEAVASIHEKNVVHSDLKPANFLLVNGGLKLIDFGIAASIQTDMTSIFKDTQCGTCNYMAPEAIKSHSPAGASQQEYKINKKTDVWSLGCILYALIYKNPPFSKIRDNFEKLNAIVDDSHVIDFPAGADPLVVDVLKACLDRNPLKRPTIAQLLSHPYLTYTCPSVTSQAQERFTYIETVLAPFIENGKLKEDVKDWIMKKL